MQSKNAGSTGVGGALLFLALFLALFGCSSVGPSGLAPSGVSPAPAVTGRAVVADGIYRVRGRGRHWAGVGTTPVSGYVVVRLSRLGYRASFHLQSARPGAIERAQLQWVGRGEGEIVRGQLRGGGRVQLVRAGSRAIDVRFPFMPHRVEAPLSIRTLVYVLADGRVRFELEGPPDRQGRRAKMQLYGRPGETGTPEARLALSDALSDRVSPSSGLSSELSKRVSSGR